MNENTALRRIWKQARNHRVAPYAVGGIVFGVLVVLPLILDWALLGLSLGSIFSVEVLLLTVLFAQMAQSWNIMSGFTGYFSFGHAAFFGIGAYTTQFLLVDYSINPWIGLIIGAFIATVFGLFIGAISFRYNLEGHYFALVTLAFAELLRYIVVNMEELNGTNGFYKPFPQEYASGPGLAAFQFETTLPYYFIALAFLFIVTLSAWAIKRSWIGLYFFAIREDEQAAESLGVPTFRYKLYGIGISAFFTAWAGAYWSMYFNTIRPSTVFDIFRNIDIILPAIIGGPGSVIGPIIGAFAVTPVTEYLRNAFEIPALDRLVYGVILVLIPIFTPQGMISWPRRMRDLRYWLRSRFAGSDTE